MEELMDMIISGESPAEVSDRIKKVLFTKSMERIDAVRPIVSADMFSDE